MPQDQIHGTVVCTNCNRAVQKAVCKSDENGNAGRLYVSCQDAQPDGSSCSFFRWYSPKSSPIPSQVPFPNPPPLTLSMLDAVTTALAIPSCSTFSCISKRIHPACQNRACRRHCRAIGGCSAKGHAAAGEEGVITTQGKGKATNSPSRSPSFSPPPPAQPRPPVQTPATSSAHDAFAHPRYASQMLPVFTEQYALEQTMVEQRRVIDAERLANVQKAKDHAIGYGWAKDGVEPTVFEFQGGFKWPHFVLTAEALADLDIYSAGGDAPRYVKLYNTTIRTWTKVKLGHIVALKEGDRVFVKALDVIDCTDFDKLLANSSSKNNDFHIRRNLPQERAQVREALKARSAAREKSKNVVIELESDSEHDDFTTRRGAPVKPFIAPAPRFRFKYEGDLREEPTSDDMPAGPGSTLVSESVHRARVAKRALSSSSASPSSSSRESTPHSSTTSSPNPGQTHGDPIQVDDEIVTWPSDFYVVDIVDGFLACDKARRSKIGISDTFVKFFCVPFKSSTFYKNRERWEAAPQAVRDKALAAKHTPNGLWSAFISQVRLEGLKQSKKAIGSKKKKMKV